MEEKRIQFTKLYRPHIFDEVVSQQEAVSVLKNSVLNNSILNFILLKGTRGSGKCFYENELLLTKNGIFKGSELRPNKDRGFTDFSFPLINKSGEVEFTSRYYSNGKKECLRIVTKHGYETVVTKNHPLLVYDDSDCTIKWVPAQDLKIGQCLLVRLGTQVFPSDYITSEGFNYEQSNHDTSDSKFPDRKLPSVLDETIATIMGLFVADACTSESQENTISFLFDIGIDPDMEQKISSLFKDAFNYSPKWFKGNKNKRKGKKSNLATFPFSYKKAQHLLFYWGLKQTTSAFKEIPWSIRRSPRKVQAAFLRGLFEADGSAFSTGGSFNIQYSTASKELAHQLQVVLANFGIFSWVKSRWNKDFDKFYYYVTISEGNSIEAFKEIGFLSERKKSLLSEYHFDPSTQPFRCVENAKNLNHRLYLESLLPKRDKVLLYPWSSVKSLTRSRIEMILSRDNSISTQSKEIISFLKDFKAEEIYSIKNAGFLETMDFEMPQSHSFILDSIVSHNTTLARIYAAAVNCEHSTDGNPCLECESCKEIMSGMSQDIIEIDAASKRTIDDMRQLAKQLDYSTFSLKYRVVILDEVHSLTPEAWQSLLKTLEEPRDNCIFIMATTDPEKIPDTILSRAVSLTVRRIKAVDIAANLKKICEQQKIKYEESALHTIAKKSGGIMRDSVKDLDTVYSVFGEVTSKNVMEIFSVVDLAVITSFIQTVFSEPVSVVLNETRSIENLFPNSQRFLIKLYETLLDCVKLKLGVDLTSVYSADEIQQMQQVITSIPTKFLWQFINVIKEQLDDFNPDLPVLDYIALAMKKDKVEDSLGVSEKKEEQKFNLEASIDDI